MTARTATRSDRLLVLAACAVGILSTIGASLPYPVLPPLFADGGANGLNAYLGLPAKLLYSIAVAVNPAGLLIGSAVLGPLSDRYGRRRILLSTTTMAAIGHLVTAWSLAIEHYPLFLAARFATGLAEGNASVARALLADELRGSARAGAFASFNGALYSGWLVGPLVAGVLVQFGATMPFVVASATLAATGLMGAAAFRPLPPSRPEGRLWEIVAQRHALVLLKQRPLRQLFFCHLGYTLGATAFYEFYPVWMVEFGGFGSTGIAVLTALLCGVMAGTSMLAGRAGAPPPSPLRLSRYALAAALAILATVLLGPRYGLVPLVLFGAPNALYNSILTVCAAERFGHLGHGGVMGLISTTYCISNIVAALGGAGITLIDTRLILVLGAAATGWAAWRVGRWARDDRAPVPLAAE
jgi:MFS family permease